MARRTHTIALVLGTRSGTPYSGIQSQLTSLGLGSTLTPADVALRAQVLSYAGCHRLNNNVAVGGGLTWPASLGFTHVSERETEVVSGETRFKISDALLNALLPARKAIFEDYLNNRPRPSKGPNHPRNGWRSPG